MLVLYTIHIHKGVFVTASEVQCTLFLMEVSRKLALKDAFWSSTVRVYTIMHALYVPAYRTLRNTRQV